MAVKGFNGSKHADKNGQRLREQTLGRMGSNEGVEDEGRLAIAEGEEEVGLVQLGTGGIGENELGSNEVVAGNAESYGFSVELFDGLEILRQRAGFE